MIYVIIAMPVVMAVYGIFLHSHLDRIADEQDARNELQRKNQLAEHREFLKELTKP